MYSPAALRPRYPNQLPRAPAEHSTPHQHSSEAHPMYFTAFQMESLANKMISFSKIAHTRVQFPTDSDSSTDALTEYTLCLLRLVGNVVKEHNDALREYVPDSTEEDITGETILLTKSTVDVESPMQVEDEDVSGDNWITKERFPIEMKEPTKKSGRNRGKDHPRRAELDKRYAANNGDEVSKRNLFCPNGDGVNGEKEHKAGGKKITGCSYCCRTQATMDKHISSCRR